MFSPPLNLKQLCVFLAALGASLSFTIPAEASTVRLLFSEEMGFVEGQQSVQVELRASGYSVTIEHTDALEPENFLGQLQSPTSNQVIASVAVVRLGRGGIAYVWLSGAEQMYRVTSSETDPARAANVLSLRVVELISLEGTGYQAELPARPLDEKQQSPATKPVVASIPPKETPHWTLFAAVGPKLGAGLKTPLVEGYLALNRSATTALSFELGGHFSLGAPPQSFEQGDVHISQKGVSLSALLQNAGAVRLQLGPNIGFRCLRLRSVSKESSTELLQNVCGSTFGALFRVGTSWDSLSLWISGLGSFGARRVDLIADKAVLAKLGRPDGWVGLTMGWQF